MGKYIRKCKAVGDVAVMDMSPVGVRTRARTLALAAAAGTGKRIVSDPGELRTVRMPEDSENSDDRITADRCSSNGSSELVKEWLRSADSEVEFECRCNLDEIHLKLSFIFFNLPFFFCFFFLLLAFTDVGNCEGFSFHRQVVTSFLLHSFHLFFVFFVFI